MAGGMATTHLSRTRKEALALDLEAAVLACYGYHGQAKASKRSINQMLSRLKSLLSRGKDQFAQRDLLHGYIFDAWSGRKCVDQFLELTARWPLDTDSYLKLLTGLDLGDQLVATLLTVTLQESTRLMSLILESAEVSTKQFSSLFVWTVDQIDIRYRKKQDPSHSQDAHSNPGEIMRLWTDRAKECENTRRLFRVSFRTILRQLIVRHSRRHRGGISYWGLGDGDQVDTTQTAVADEIIQGLLADIITILTEHPVQGEGEEGGQFVQEIFEDVRRWDQFCTASGLKISEQLSSIVRTPKRRKQEGKTMRTKDATLQAILQRDAEFAVKKNRSITANGNGLQQSPWNNHEGAFITICDNLRQKHDFPGYPPTPMSRLTTYMSLDSRQERAKCLLDHIEWVESTIRYRSAGWLSCAKLKLQFFAIFDESYVNEELADIICDHNLHWDLCSTLLKYLRRHRADPTRMTADTFQLGCELLLSVFTKRVGLRLSLRDHLFRQSNLICKDATGPLFGSWDFWRISIDTLLTSTLNQVVVSEDSLQSSAVSSNTVETLVKISLIAPYRVLSRVVHSIIVNRGQCGLLIQVILGLGQLAWLRASPTEPTLLVTVLQHLLKSTANEDGGPELLWSDQQLDNFVDFVTNAMATRSFATGMLVLDPKELLTDCVAPFLDDMEVDHPSPLFQAVTRILLKMYEPEPAQASSTGVTGIVLEGERLLPRGIQLQILLRLLQLRTQENYWTADEGQGCCRKTIVDRCGGENLDGLSRLCETIVLWMNAYVSSLADFDQEERELFSEFLQSVQETGSEPVDLESTLIVVPLIEACRRTMALDLGLPSLPAGLFRLCGDRLKVFEYSRSVSQHTDPLLLDKAAEALVLLLDLGRMCDDVLADLIQAIEFGDIPSSAQHALRLIMAPALYRVLSISTRQQSHRLLTHAVPVLAQLWGGPSDPSLFWDDQSDNSAQYSRFPKLEPYWDKFKHGAHQLGGDESETSTSSTFKTTGDALDILLTLESTLRFSLDPLPTKDLKLVLQVFQSDLGYDMMPDQVTSLIQFIFKSIRIEWTNVPLDHLLYCFMKVCKMSYIVDSQHQVNPYPNRLTPQAKLVPPPPLSSSSNGNDSSSTDESLRAWQNAYLDHMSQPMDGETRRQLDVARAKARDELVLMAMNFSNALVSHQDNIYGHSPELAGDIYMQEVTVGGHVRGRARRGGRGRGRGGRERREGNREIGDRDEGVVRCRNRQEAWQATGGQLDKGTQAWFNGIMTSPPLDRPTKDDADESQGRTSNASTPDVSGVQHKDARTVEESVAEDAAVEKPKPKEMLNPNQVDCLLLALAYLPTQESQAVRSRLHRFLNAQPTSHF
ncbi:hypothetical protein BGZ95_005881 [Linnemannia exigua]|uniref:Uncharacterized protein n=1 Tax=Linnemannia exigua TaxID=604196 RepID=A0AAD4H8V9_9FUNG|nr:hypothetical protein BGZ95_005881 [Linnemannia exigua]